MGDESVSPEHLYRHVRNQQFDLCFVCSSLPDFSAGHLLKSLLERGLILIRQIFSPVNKNLSQIVN